MDYGTLLLVLIVFGVVSFIIEKLSGFNPYMAYVLLGLANLVLSLLYIVWPVLTDQSNIGSLITSFDRLGKWLINFLPGAIVGNVAGIIIAKITGQG